MHMLTCTDDIHILKIRGTPKSTQQAHLASALRLRYEGCTSAAVFLGSSPTSPHTACNRVSSVYRQVSRRSCVCAYARDWLVEREMAFVIPVACKQVSRQSCECVCVYACVFVCVCVRVRDSMVI